MEYTVLEHARGIQPTLTYRDTDTAVSAVESWTAGEGEERFTDTPFGCWLMLVSRDLSTY